MLHIYNQTNTHLNTDIVQLIAGAFFFGMRLCEYSTTPKGDTKRTRILQKGHIQFYIKRRELTQDSRILHLVNKLSPTFCTQKNAVKNGTIKQWRTTTSLSLVSIWAEIIIELDSYPGTTLYATVNTVWVYHHKTAITSQMTTKYLSSGTISFGKQSLGFSHKDVGTQSLRSGFSMGLLIAKFYPETTTIMV